MLFLKILTINLPRMDHPRDFLVGDADVEEVVGNQDGDDLLAGQIQFVAVAADDQGALGSLHDA